VKKSDECLKSLQVPAGIHPAPPLLNISLFLASPSLSVLLEILGEKQGETEAQGVSALLLLLPSQTVLPSTCAGSSPSRQQTGDATTSVACQDYLRMNRRLVGGKMRD